MKRNSLIFFGFVVVILSSCITQKRCSERFPPQIVKETVIKDSMIVTERTKFDTIINSSKDTVFLYDHETRIKIKYLNLPGDSVFVSAECPEDTIKFRTHTITNNVIHEEEKSFGLWGWLLVVVGVVGGLFGLSYLIKQIKR